MMTARSIINGEVGMSMGVKRQILTPVICAVTVYAPNTTARTEMKCAVKKINRKGIVICILDEPLHHGGFFVKSPISQERTSSALKNGTIAMANGRMETSLRFRQSPPLSGAV